MRDESDDVNEQSEADISFAPVGLPDELSITGVAMTAEEHCKLDRFAATFFSDAPEFDDHTIDHILGDIEAIPTPRLITNRPVQIDMGKYGGEGRGAA